MVNQLYPVLDGIEPSWADIIVRATPDGAPLIQMDDIVSIDTGATVEVGLVKGASGGRVMRRTTGEVSYEFSWTLYRSGLRKLLEALAPIAPKRGNQRLVSLVHMTIQVQHQPPGTDIIHEYRAKGLRLTGINMSHAEGVDADRVEVPCSILEKVHMINGVEVVLL